jgi:cell surface protein SprA
MPFSIDYAGSGVQQLFINRSDVRASGIQGLRNPSDSRANYAVALRRATPLTSGWYAPVLNGLSLAGSWSTGASQSAFQEGTSNNYVLGAALDLSDDRREDRLPRVVDRLLGVLPRFMRESGAIRRVRSQNYRWQPTQLRFTSSMVRNANSTTSYTKAATALSDTGQLVQGLNHAWVNAARLELRPLTSLTGSVDARQVLDLRDYRDANLGAGSTDRRQAAAAERLRVLGASVKLEQERTVTSGVLFQPQWAIWLQPRLDVRSTFRLSKTRTPAHCCGRGRFDERVSPAEATGSSQSFTAGTQLQVGRLLMMRGAKVPDSPLRQDVRANRRHVAAGADVQLRQHDLLAGAGLPVGHRRRGNVSWPLLRSAGKYGGTRQEFHGHQCDESAALAERAVAL